MCFETYCLMNLQSHPRLILAPINGAWDFLLVLNSNLSPTLPRFRDIIAFVCRKPLFPYPTPIPAKISGVPLGVDP